MRPPPTPQSILSRLVDATNAHDLDALAGCFAENYRNETPVHPGRGFSGHDQVRRNWQQIFEAVPDVHATVLSTAVEGDAIWSEWAMSGTRGDGSPHRMAGVIIFGVRGDEIASARFYLEPLDDRPGGADDAVRAVVRT